MSCYLRFFAVSFSVLLLAASSLTRSFAQAKEQDDTVCLERFHSHRGISKLVHESVECSEASVEMARRHR